MRLYATLGIVALLELPIRWQAPAPADNNRLDMGRRIHIHATRTTLSGALADVTSQSGAAVFIDGSPLHDSEDIDINGPLHEVLDRVCDAYDSTWSLASGANAILVRKRFRTEGELPQMHVAELRACASDILFLMPDGVEPDGTNTIWDGCLRSLYVSLPPMQRQELAAGGTIGVSDLSPQQAEGLRRAIEQRAYGAPKAAWGTIYNTLGILENSEIRAIVDRPLALDQNNARHMTVVIGAAGKASSGHELVLGQITE